MSKEIVEALREIERRALERGDVNLAAEARADLARRGFHLVGQPANSEQDGVRLETTAETAPLENTAPPPKRRGRPPKKKS